MEMEENKIDIVLINKLVKKLTTIFYEEIKVACEANGFHLTDLLNRHRDGTDKNTSNEGRRSQNDEARIAKVLKVATDLASDPESSLSKSQSTLSLMKQLSIKVCSPLRNSRVSTMANAEPSKTFHKPQDVFQYNYEREKEKFQKSLKMIEKISSLKEKNQKNIEEKLKKIADREKKLMSDKKKKVEEHEKHTQTQIEKRRQILNKKCQIEENFSKQCFDMGEQLEKRMLQFTEKEKNMLRENLWKKQKKIKMKILEEFQKVVMDEAKYKHEEEKINRMITKLKEKIETRVNQCELNVKKKIESARSHSQKVEKILSQSTQEESQYREDLLKKIINKTKLCEVKKGKKLTMTKENASKIRNGHAKSFDRHTRGIEDVNKEEIRRLENIELRELEKQKTFEVIRKGIKKNYIEKRWQNEKKEHHHTVKYNKTQENHMRYKEKIMQKHQKLSQMAEEIKAHKDLLSNIKRRNNYEVQNARSLHTSPGKLRTTVTDDSKHTFSVGF